MNRYLSLTNGEKCFYNEDEDENKNISKSVW